MMRPDEEHARRNKVNDMEEHQKQPKWLRLGAAGDLKPRNRAPDAQATARPNRLSSAALVKGEPWTAIRRPTQHAASRTVEAFEQTAPHAVLEEALRDWIVPALARRFLRERAALAKDISGVKNSTTGTRAGAAGSQSRNN